MRKVVVGLGCVLLMSAPAMACLLPDGQLSAAEKQCCREMAGECGRTNMPSSHSCCTPVVRPDHVLVPNKCASSLAHLNIASALPTEMASGANAERARFPWLLDSHSPPESPSSLSSVLRI